MLPSPLLMLMLMRRPRPQSVSPPTLPPLAQTHAKHLQQKQGNWTSISAPPSPPRFISHPCASVMECDTLTLLWKRMWNIFLTRPYVPINCMLSHIFLCFYCRFFSCCCCCSCCCATVPETGTLQQHERCVAVKHQRRPTHFPPWLFAHLSTADISELDGPPAARTQHIQSRLQRGRGAGAAELQCCSPMAPWGSALCSFAETRCHLRSSKHQFGRNGL